MVVLPAPLRPTRPMRSPDAIWKFVGSRRVRAPTATESSRATITRGESTSPRPARTPRAQPVASSSNASWASAAYTAMASPITASSNHAVAEWL